MKSLGHWLMYPILLSMLVACGKENESGKTPIPLPGMGNPYTSGATPYNYQNVNVEQVLLQNPCAGVAGAQGRTQYVIDVDPMQFNPPTQIGAGDFFVGVTSYGDVAVIHGRGANQPAQFIGYLCARTHIPPNTPSQLLPGIKIGASTRCLFKPITAATITFANIDRADFRILDGGTSRRVPFTPPVCN